MFHLAGSISFKRVPIVKFVKDFDGCRVRGDLDDALSVRVVAVFHAGLQKVEISQKKLALEFGGVHDRILPQVKELLPPVGVDVKNTRHGLVIQRLAHTNHLALQVGRPHKQTDDIAGRVCHQVTFLGMIRFPFNGKLQRALLAIKRENTVGTFQFMSSKKKLLAQKESCAKITQLSLFTGNFQNISINECTKIIFPNTRQPNVHL